MLNVPYQSQERPPFIRFEEREHGRNEAASQVAGRPVPQIVDFVCITPFGSKDSVEKIAVEWLDSIHQKAVRGEFNPEWAKKFRFQYDEWKKGHELPREGTPISTCPLFTRDQAVRLRAIDVTTVEDLTQVPDSGLGMIGLDGRHLRDQARTWIAEAKDKGVTARALADANTSIETLQVRVDGLERENAELRSRLPKGKAA